MTRQNSRRGTPSGCFLFMETGWHKVHLLTNVGAAEDGNENKNYIRKIRAKVIDITELTCYNGAKKPAGKRYTFCKMWVGKMRRKTNEKAIIGRTDGDVSCFDAASCLRTGGGGK